MSDFLSKYPDFISQFEMVGSNIAFCKHDGYFEYVSTGLSSIEKDIHSHDDSIYRIASISKVIVAIGVLKLYEENKLDLDEDISKYFGFSIRNPKYPDVNITIRHLMTQTSSICDDGAFVDGVYKGYDGANSTDDFIKVSDILNPSGVHYGPSFTENKPGDVFLYSNFGCGLLACIVERISGEYFPEYIKRVLLKPLSINSGFRLEDLKHPENLVSHYLYDNGDFILYRNYQSFKKVQCLKYPLGENYRGVAGGLYISAKDLSKIMMMLMNKGKYLNIRILEESTVREMEKVQWEGHPLDPTYKKKGLQMIIMDEFTKSPLKGHFGNAYGLRSFMLYNDNGGIIFLCNGANFITDEEHMTTLQRKTIEFFVKELNL